MNLVLAIGIMSRRVLWRVSHKETQVPQDYRLYHHRYFTKSFSSKHNTGSDNRKFGHNHRYRSGYYCLFDWREPSPRTFTQIGKEYRLDNIFSKFRRLASRYLTASILISSHLDHTKRHFVSDLFPDGFYHRRGIMCHCPGGNNGDSQ